MSLRATPRLSRPSEADLRQFLRFLVVGLANTAIGVALFALIYALLGDHVVAAFASAILAILIGFLLTGHGVFGFVSWRSLVLYVLWYAGLASLNAFTIDAGVRWGINPYLASVFAAPVVMVVSYLVNRLVIFRRDAAAAPNPTQGAMAQPAHPESFKPIPVVRGEGPLGRALFGLRLVGDLQLLTCTRFLAPRLAQMHGDVLDVGCGEMPFRGFLPPGARYIGLDVPAADDFGMRRHPEVVDFDGLHIPFADASQDHVLCTEVLEHAEDPLALIAEMHRVLRPGGTLLVTVPFSARVHHAPHDHHRFTSFRLARMFAAFDEVRIEERGDDLAVIANKLIVVCARLADRRRPLRALLLLLAAPPALLALGLAHLSLWFGWGSKADPLGYAIVARKG